MYLSRTIDCCNIETIYLLIIWCSLKIYSTKIWLIFLFSDTTTRINYKWITLNKLVSFKHKSNKGASNGRSRKCRYLCTNVKIKTCKYNKYSRKVQIPEKMYLRAGANYLYFITSHLWRCWASLISFLPTLTRPLRDLIQGGVAFADTLDHVLGNKGRRGKLTEWLEHSGNLSSTGSESSFPQVLLATVCIMSFLSNSVPYVKASFPSGICFYYHIIQCKRAESGFEVKRQRSQRLRRLPLQHWLGPAPLSAVWDLHLRATWLHVAQWSRVTALKSFEAAPDLEPMHSNTHLCHFLHLLRFQRRRGAVGKGGRRSEFFFFPWRR